MKYLLAFFLLLSLTHRAEAHKFYMSITQMNYNEKTASLEISIKFFTDDLEQAVEHEKNIALRLGTSLQNKNAEQLLMDYLSNKFILKQEVEMPQEFLGAETEYDYTYCYIEIKNFDKDKDFSVLHKALMEIFPEQLNKLNYNRSENSISHSSTSSKPTQYFKLH